MTRIININTDDIKSDAIQEAAKIIQKGGTVAFPTETVYGLGANGLDEEAVRKIYIAKGRPSDNPIILHVSKIEMLNRIVKEIPPKGKKLTEKFWPGPLTLIFKKSNIVPNIITAGLETVAVRMPSNNIALSIIEESNLPIAAPSANISGRPSPTKSEHVIEDLEGKIDLIIASESSKIGIESTVLDITGDVPVLLRPGGISVEEIEEIVGKVKIDPALINGAKVQRAKSPGMKYKHYAPKAPIKIIRGQTEQLVETINRLSDDYRRQGKRVGILSTAENYSKYRGDKIIDLGSKADMNRIMANLFERLRAFDKEQVDIILSEGFGDTGMELAISNRLNKAAGYDIIEV